MGGLFVINSEDNSSTRIATHLHSCWSHYWWVPRSQRTNFPKSVMHVMWLYSHEGLRLWVPSLDSEGQRIDLPEALVLPLDSEVYPLGVHPVFNTVIGIRQRSVKVTSLRLTCFEACLRAQPCLHGLLQWLLATDRGPQAAQILGVSTSAVPFLAQALEYWLFSTTEREYMGQGRTGATGQVLGLLHEFDLKLATRVLVHCARKMEHTRLGLILPSAVQRVELFERCMASGHLRLAAASVPLLPEDQELVHEKLLGLYKAATAEGDEQLAQEILQSVEKMEPAGLLSRVLRRLPQVV